jgi:4a-hydroxytetrahydrobiopterin dehydratase
VSGANGTKRRCRDGAPRLDDATIAARLAALPGWRVEAGALRRTFALADFRHAIFFVNGVAAIAERENHHPDLAIRYREVDVALTTHDAGGITENDLVLAELIDGVG